MLPPAPPLKSPEDMSGDRHSLSYSPSILIIAGILAFAVVAIASIQLLLRYLSRSRDSPSPSPSPNSPSPPFLHRHLPSSLSTPNSEDPMKKDVDVIDSLPLFSFSFSAAAAAAATKPSSSVDCAVCLSPFEARDRLRLLPSCRHAFHSQCIDTWLRSTLSCPLCRSSVHPPPAPAGELSYRVEIGSASRRTADEIPPPPPPHVRTNSLGSSFEYLVEEEEEVEAVLSRIRRPEKSAAAPAAPPAGEAEMAGEGGGGSMNWLRDYVDRFVSSASSSFSSIRWSCRLDSGGSGGGGGGGGGGGVAHGGEHYWDLERNLHLHLEEEDGGFSSFYRWLLGA